MAGREVKRRPLRPGAPQQITWAKATKPGFALQVIGVVFMAGGAIWMATGHVAIGAGSMGKTAA